MQLLNEKNAQFCNLIYKMLRIKELRTLKNVTQDEISEAIGVSKRSFIDYETEKTDIPIKKLQKIATFLNVSIAELMGEKEPSFANVEKISTDKTPAVITVDSHNKDNIVLVPYKLKAGYLQGYNDPKFIKKLPSFRLPGINNGIFRMFEIEGLSMFPTLSGGYVVGQFVENWSRDIKDNRIYAVISNEVQDGLIKRCINRIDKYNNLICKSDNRRNFPTQNINPSSIKEIWEIKVHLNFNLPDPADIYDRVSDLEAELQEIKRKI